MAEEFDITIKDQFEELLNTNDTEKLREFLNDQNISDVAELIDEYPDHEAEIISNMNVNRAASTFKILDFSVQKRIIQQLPAERSSTG